MINDSEKKQKKTKKQTQKPTNIETQHKMNL